MTAAHTMDSQGYRVNNDPSSIFFGVRALETPDVLDRFVELSDCVRNVGLLITKEVDEAIFAQACAEVILNRPELADRKAAIEKITTGT